MEKKRIVILGSAHPLRGGLAAYNERLAEEFMAEGNEVIIYTFSLQYPGIFFPGKTQYADWEAPKNLDIRVKVNSVNPLNWLKVGAEIKKLRPDILIFKYWIPFMAPCFGTIARIVKGNKQTKIISILDNIIPHEKRPGDTALSHFFSKAMDAFVGMSKSVLNDLNIFDTKKPRAFNPHPLFDNFGARLTKQEAADAIGLDADAKYLLFFGFIRAYKGLDLLLHAMADERIKQLGIKCIVAGEFYEDGERYHQIIAEKGLQESVVLKTDFIPNDEVNRFFSIADMVVQPYKSATQSGVTQIGYHFEVPMLVTDVGGLKEIIPDGKVGYVTAPDSKAIADALVDFYENNRGEQFDAGLKEEKKKYLWSKMTNTIYKLTKEI